MAKNLKANNDNKFIAAVIAIIITAILLILNFYGAKSVDFDLTKDSAVTIDGFSTYTPHLSLKTGEYEFQINGGRGTVAVYNAEGKLLGDADGRTTFTVTLDKDESDIIICGEADSSFSNVKVNSNGMLSNDIYFITLFLVLLMAYLVYIRFKKPTEDSAAALIMICAVILASYPAMTDSVLFGHDLNFHLYRIEGIKDGLLSGQFPVRIHPTHNNGYGYITASVYPEMFLYFPAMLRIFGVSPSMAYNTFLVFVNAMTAYVMYVSAKGVTKSKFAGVSASVIYTLSTWKVINLFYRAAIGEALAMVFFPLVIYGIYCILKGDKKKWWVLALACTGIFQSHIISTVFVAIVLIVSVIVFWRDFISEKRWLGFVKAGVFTVLLNLWYLVPFVRYYMGLDMAIKHFPENTEFYQNALFPTQLFNIFNTNFGYSYLLNYGVKHDMSLTLGVGVTVCAIVCLFYFMFRKKRDLKENEGFVFSMFALGVILLFMTTTLFPWQLLQQSKLINKFCGTVRMPWRFLSLASPIFTIGAAAIVDACAKKDVTKRIILAVTAFVCALSFVSWGTAYTTQNDAVMKKYRAAPTLGSAGLDNEYYVMGTDRNFEPNNYVSSGNVRVSDYEKSGTKLTVSLSGNVTDSSWLEVPLLYYPGYTAKNDKGERLEVVNGTGNVARVNLKSGTDEVRVKYSGFWYFKIADLLTVLTLAAWGLTAYGKRRGKEWKFLWIA